jgi:phospholipid transport system substrate-binding protein
MQIFIQFMKFGAKYLTLILASLLVLSLSFSNLKANEEEKGKVKDYATKVTGDAIDILNNVKDKQERRTKIITLFEKNVDSNIMANFVIGKYLRELSDAQKQRYYKIYKEYVINNYVPQFIDYDAGGYGVYQVNEIKENTYLAKVNIRKKKEKIDVKVDYRIIKNKDGNFKITDFIGEGVSLIMTQRNDFNAILDQKGVDGFLNFLSDKVKELKSKKL